MKKIFKRIFRVFLVLLSLISIYLLAVFLLPLFSVNADEKDSDEITIYILTNGVHTDIVCPIKNDVIDWSEVVPFENTLSKRTDFNYAAFGWGDKGFYLDTPTWADLKASTAFKAAFWLSESAMHVTFYRNPKTGKDCREIKINKEDYRLLVDYIRNSFDYKQEKTVLIPTEMVYGQNDAFYNAKWSYNLFYTCNTWANDALKAANQKAPIWTATDRGIFRHYK